MIKSFSESETTIQNTPQKKTRRPYRKSAEILKSLEGDISPIDAPDLDFLDLKFLENPFRPYRGPEFTKSAIGFLMCMFKEHNKLSYTPVRNLLPKRLESRPDILQDPLNKAFFKYLVNSGRSINLILKRILGAWREARIEQRRKFEKNIMVRYVEPDDNSLVNYQDALEPPATQKDRECGSSDATLDDEEVRKKHTQPSMRIQEIMEKPQFKRIMVLVAEVISLAIDMQNI